MAPELRGECSRGTTGGELRDAACLPGTAAAPYLVAAVSGWGVSRSRRPDVSPAFGVSRRGVYLVECISYAPLTSLYLVETRISYQD